MKWKCKIFNQKISQSEEDLEKEMNEWLGDIHDKGFNPIQVAVVSRGPVLVYTYWWADD